MLNAECMFRRKARGIRKNKGNSREHIFNSCVRLGVENESYLDGLWEETMPLGIFFPKGKIVWYSKQ